MKADFAFQEGKEKFSTYFLKARTREDLEKRTRLHRAIAAMSHGLLGRSPDHVSSFVTGMAMNSSVFGKFEKNLIAYYEKMRREDLYGVYAVIPPQAARNPSSTSSRTSRCRLCAWCARTTTAWSSPA
jgi:4-hydroxyphenylacetate 3-monooxygenase